MLQPRTFSITLLATLPISETKLAAGEAGCTSTRTPGRSEAKVGTVGALLCGAMTPKTPCRFTFEPAGGQLQASLLRGSQGDKRAVRGNLVPHSSAFATDWDPVGK